MNCRNDNLFCFVIDDKCDRHHFQRKIFQLRTETSQISKILSSSNGNLFTKIINFELLLIWVYDPIQSTMAIFNDLYSVKNKEE